MRELYNVQYDSKVYTDENLLYKHRLIDPVRLSKNFTYLYGRDSDMFPLLGMTEGQNAFQSIKPKELNDTQYTWDIMGRMKHTSRVVGLADGANATPGRNFEPFEMDFEDNWFHAYYSAFSPDQRFAVRIQREPQRLASGKYRALVRIMNTVDPTVSIPLDNFQAGRAWVMGATSVTASLSDGTTSNQMFPGKMTNQFGWQRYSKQIAGNVANKVTVYEFDLEGGGKTNYWIPFEMKLWEMERRLLNESDLWYSEYNRDENGVIHLVDEDNGLPIPKGAGVKEILTSFGHYDTYGPVLTKAKIDATLSRCFDNRVDDTPTEIVMYTGRGGAKMFHNMIMNDAVMNGYFVALGNNTISGGDYLSYGKYFNQYKTIDGKILTVKVVKLFDHGLFAEQNIANSEYYEGHPWTSYTMIFLDHSKSNDGERNIQLVAEKGREHITGVYKGLTPLPGAWGGIPDQFLSTRKDMAAYEVMTSQGITIKNPTTSFWLDFVFN
jgi:hypothetical protein